MLFYEFNQHAYPESSGFFLTNLFGGHECAIGIVGIVHGYLEILEDEETQ